MFVTKAIHEKHIHKEYIGCDASAVNLMRPLCMERIIYNRYGKENLPEDHKNDITGSLSEINEKFAIDECFQK
jgi:diaminopimelate decarboxylase